MEEEHTWLSKIFDSLEELENISMYLIRLGDSFDMTGNKIMGNTLVDTSTLIHKNIETIRESISEDVNEQFKTAQQHSTNIVKVLLNKEIKK